MRNRTGFFEHADEYRQFALGLLQLRQTQRERLALMPVYSTIVPLPKCDETSMDQVAELLDLLQSLEIQ